MTGFQQSLGQNEVGMVRQGVQQVGVIAVGGDGHDIFVSGFHGGIVLGEVRHVGLALGGDHGGDHVLSGHLGAVVELDAFAEFEGPGVAVLGNFVAFRQIRHGVHVVVQLHQTVVAQHVQVSGLQGVVAGGGQVRALVRRRHNQRVLGFGRSEGSHREQHHNSHQ